MLGETGIANLSSSNTDIQAGGGKMNRPQCVTLLISYLLAFGLSGCSKKSDDDDTAATTTNNNDNTNVQQDPATGSTWDRMVWDKGKWD